MQIIPTTELQKDFAQLEQRVREIKKKSRWIQVDVADNVFTSGKTFELELLNRIEFETSDILWEIHLMVKSPQNWIEKCMYVGASRIIGQVEMMEDRKEFVEKIKNEGLEVGLAFDVESEVDDIPDGTDVILLMGRKAGFGEYPLDERIFEKIKQAKKYEKLIAVDGGVNLDNIQKLKNAGVNIVYSGKNYEEIYDLG